MNVFQKLGDTSSLRSTRLQLKSLLQLIKQEKKKKGGHGGHAHSERATGRSRAHTVSRASHFDLELGRIPMSRSSERAQVVRDKMGTWSEGRRPCPALDFGPSDDLGPDPLLVMADMVPTWEGAGLGHSVCSPGYTLQPPTSARSCDCVHERSYRSEYKSCGCESSVLQCQHISHSLETLSSVSNSSCESCHHLTPPERPRNPTHSHTHPLHFSQRHAHHISDGSNDRGGARIHYESVGPRHAPHLDHSDTEFSSAGRSTALPSLSYSSSLGPSLPEGRGSSAHETEVEELEDHMWELKRAGLELARAGLQLAGYEGAEELGVEEGTDKEWEQWQQIKEEERG